MALRETLTSCRQTGISPLEVIASALAGLNVHWSDPQEPPFLEWEKWIGIFTVAMMTKIPFRSRN